MSSNSGYLGTCNQGDSSDLCDGCLSVIVRSAIVRSATCACVVQRALKFSSRELLMQSIPTFVLSLCMSRKMEMPNGSQPGKT